MKKYLKIFETFGYFKHSFEKIWKNHKTHKKQCCLLVLCDDDKI